jgi:hypothetical protein
MTKVRLSEGAKVFRSKNAGPFRTTIDIFYSERSRYEAIKDSGRLTADAIARQLRIPESAVEGIFFHDDVCGIKITIGKHPGMASGDLRCADTFGAQQYVPLRDMEIDLDR